MNRNSIIVTQKLSDLDGYRKNIVFNYWLSQISKKDKLPRGKFFKGKVGSKGRVFIMDEAHRFLSPSSESREALNKIDRSSLSKFVG